MNETYISFGNKETNLVHYNKKKNDFSKKEKDMAELFFSEKSNG